MRPSGLLITLLILTLAPAVACAGPASADERPSGEQPAVGERARAQGAANDPAPQPAESRRASGRASRDAEEERPALPSAEVTDVHGNTIEIDEAAFYEPTGGLFQMGGPTRLEELSLWRGAHEIIIAMDKIASVEVGEAENLRLIEVRVTLKKGDQVSGKVERTLELHGKVRFGKYRIELGRVKRVDFRG